MNINWLQILQDREGALSSKRVGFLSSLFSAIVFSTSAIFTMLFNQEYKLAIELIIQIWWVCAAFSGIVLAEIIPEFFKKKNATENKTIDHTNI